MCLFSDSADESKPSESAQTEEVKGDEKKATVENAWRWKVPAPTTLSPLMCGPFPVWLKAGKFSSQTVWLNLNVLGVVLAVWWSSFGIFCTVQNFSGSLSHCLQCYFTK